MSRRSRARRRRRTWIMIATGAAAAGVAVGAWLAKDGEPEIEPRPDATP
ncbi:hypothetical protein AB0B28_05775 [Glycomyces sp. NPDC046736]